MTTTRSTTLCRGQTSGGFVVDTVFVVPTGFIAILKSVVVSSGSDSSLVVQGTLRSGGTFAAADFLSKRATAFHEPIDWYQWAVLEESDHIDLQTSTPASFWCSGALLRVP